MNDSPSNRLTEFARALRRSHTDAERRLWKELRGRQFQNLKFRRQQPIGRYIADFCCLEIGPVIELDGGQHETQAEQHHQRTQFLHSRGFTVLRFWNDIVLTQTDVVLENIPEIVADLSRSPHPNPLPEGEGA